jgi:hypothetical protein
MANCRGDHVLLPIALLSFVFVSPIIYLHAWSEKFSDLAFRKVESKMTEIKGATISYPEPAIFVGRLKELENRTSISVLCAVLRLSPAYVGLRLTPYRSFISAIFESRYIVELTRFFASAI